MTSSSGEDPNGLSSEITVSVLLKSEASDFVLNLSPTLMQRYSTKTIKLDLMQYNLIHN